MNARFGDLAGKGAMGLKQPKAKRNPAHMARVAALSCVICKSWPVEVHHCISGRFGQRRASDDEVIPLCSLCHRLGSDAIHRSKRAWEEKHGPDYGFLPVVAALLDDDTEIDF